jgi:gas vesicle protein
MTRWNDQDSAGSGTFLLGALAGALVGAGVALLMAPKSGAQTRQDLSSGYNSVRDAASRRYRDLADRASAKIEQTVDQYKGRSSASTMSNPSSTTGFPQA